jgi:hypothetical protein
MAITIDDPSRLEGVVVRGHNGRKLGTVEAVYYDNTTDRPLWVTVRTGLFGAHVSVAPLADAAFDGSVLRLPHDKQTLRSAPHRDPGGELSPRDEEDLYRHYGMLGDSDPGGGAASDVGDDAPGNPAGNGDDAISRSDGPAGTGTRKAERPRRRTQAAAKRTKNRDSAVKCKKAGTRTRRRKRRR